MRRNFSLSFALTLCVALLLTAGTFPSAFAGAAPRGPRPPAPVVAGRITQAINESQLVKLGGNTRPEANRNNDRGALPDGYDIDHILLVLQRSPEQEQELEKLIDQMNDRNSSNFHQWLTAEEFGNQFGVASEDVDAVTGWLESHGFRVNQVYANHMMIDFSGNAGQLRKAFHTSMHNIEVGGQMHIANMSDPWIPSALAPVIKGVFSLNDFKPHPMYKSKTQYTYGGCASSSSVPTEPGTCYAVTPQDNAVIYNLNPLWNEGYSGQGQTIALVEDTDVYNYPGDWNTYRSTFGLSTYSGTFTQAHPGGCTDPGTNGDDGEAAIDVEVASSFAPSAAIELISCPSGSVTFGGQIALQNLINGSAPYPGVVSVSYGLCEALNGNGGNAAFFNTYQQAALEGISVFVSSGDEGPSSCSNEFSAGSKYDVTSLGVTGWGETPYNVTVGGTDFEDTYFSKTAGVPLSTYWSTSNSTTYGSALSYIPETPWNDACADVLIAEVADPATGFLTYGSTGLCNNTTFVGSGRTTGEYLSTGAASGGASNCATGSGGVNVADYLISGPQCQGYPKPSWQSGSSLAGGQAVFGVPNDGVRDIPDVSMFAANGVWGHYEVVCWSDPSYTNDGSASCAGAPSTWSGFGGTSVASPSMAAIQALVNQKTGEAWGNPNPIYYQIGQNQYGTAGGSFLGGGCNSSKGNTAGCAFNDVTQGDIDLACEDNSTVEAAHCYKPSGTHGVDSTDVVTAASLINGGTGYTSAPACLIAGPTNSYPYVAPTGSMLWAGGTQASCNASVTSGTTTAVWTVLISNSSAAGQELVVGTQAYTLSGASTSTIATALSTAINGNNTLASSTVSGSTVTITANTAGYAGNFTVSFANNGDFFGPDYVTITNTTPGQGPNYVSGITITGGGSGYQPETPITLTGGGGSGAIAVANTSSATASSSYQPAYGAAPGYDLATGLGTVNAYYFVNNCLWTTCVVSTTTAVSSSLNPSTYGQAVNFAATVSGNSPTGTVQFTIDGSNFGSPAALSGGSATSGSTSAMAVGTHAVTAVYSGDNNNTGSTGTLSGGQVVQTAGAGTITVSGTPNPSTYGQPVTFTATIPGQYGQVKGKPRSKTVTGTVTWSSNTGCGTTTVLAGDPGTASCTTSTLPAGSDTVVASYSGDLNHNQGSGSTIQAVSQGTTSISVTSVNPSSEDYGLDAPVTITAVLSWTGDGAAPTAANVTIGGNGPSGYGPTSCGSDIGNAITCTATYTPTTSDGAGSYTESANFSGDSNYTSSSSAQTNNFTINAASSSTTLALTGGTDPSPYGQSLTFTATITGENGAIRNGARRNNAPRQKTVTGTVTWSLFTDCGTTMVTPTGPGTGTATCTTPYLRVGSDTVKATYSGDSNHGGSSNTLGQTVNQATTTIAVTSVNPSSEDYGADTPVQITAVLSWVGSGNKTPTAADVTIGGSGNGTYGATTCGTPAGDTLTCSATYTPTTADNAGSYTETASFSGDTDYSASSSTQTDNFTINNASSTVSVGSSGSPSTYGSSVTFTATITGENGAIRGPGARSPKSKLITGTVTWSANTGCGTSMVTGGSPGTATCATSNLGVGSDTVTATYSGDSNHSGNTGSIIQAVSQNSSAIGVTSVSPSAEDYGSTVPVTITAVLSWTGNGTAPTAADVTIGGSGLSGSFGSTSCGQPSGNTLTCTNTYSPSGSDVPGSYTMSAAFSGDTNYTASNSPQTNNFAINQATSMTAVSSSLNPSSYGQPLTFTATISGENGAIRGPAARNGRSKTIAGTVTWSANTGCGTTTVTAGNPGTATCVTSSATRLPVGADTITATYSGDSNHSGSAGSLVQTVNQNATTISVTSVTPAAEGYGQDQQVTITAVLSWTGYGVAPTASAVNISGNGNGTYGATSCSPRNGDTITCTNTYTPTSADTPGYYNETATFAGDTNYTGSGSSQTDNFTINQATSSTTVTSNLNPSTYGQSVTFTATVSGEYNEVQGLSRRTARVMPDGRRMAPDVGGSVTWSANTGCGTTTITSGNPGAATCTTSSLPGGTDAITATYSGDSNHSGSTGTLSGGQVVNPASQTITFSINAPATAVYNTQFTVAATASSGLPVTFTSAGACSNSGATYTMTSGTGTCSVIANQAGNADYSAAPQVSESTAAQRANPTVTFTGAPATAQYQSTFVLNASTNSTSVAYVTVNNPGICSLSGHYVPITVTMLKGSGSCLFTAKWGADANYNPSSLTQTTTAEKAPPTITWATPAPITYGTPLSSTQLDPTANVEGKFQFSPAAGKIENAGTVTLGTLFTPTNTNYSDEEDTVNLLVLQATTTTTIISKSQTVQMNREGDASATLDFNVTSYKPTGAVTLTASTGEVCSGAVASATGDGGCKLIFTTTGTRTVIATYNGDSNHEGSNSSGQTPPITVTVNPF